LHHSSKNPKRWCAANAAKPIIADDMAPGTGLFGKFQASGGNSICEDRLGEHEKADCERQPTKLFHNLRLSCL
jgi:hypothetical protein